MPENRRTPDHNPQQSAQQRDTLQTGRCEHPASMDRNERSLFRRFLEVDQHSLFISLPEFQRQAAERREEGELWGNGDRLP